MSNEFPREAVGKRLTQLRERLGISGAELARNAGVSQTAVWEAEAGRKKPSADLLLGLALMGADLRELLTGTAREVSIPDDDPEWGLDAYDGEPSTNVRMATSAELQVLADCILSMPSLMQLVAASLGQEYASPDEQALCRAVKTVLRQGDQTQVKLLRAMLDTMAKALESPGNAEEPT